MNDQHLGLDDAAALDEGLLAPEQARRLEAHIAGCAACARTLEDVRGVRGTLADLGDAQTVPAHVQARLAAALAQAGQEPAARPAAPAPGATGIRRPRRARQLLHAAAKPLLATAAVLLGVVLVVNLPQGGSDDAETAAGGATSYDAPAAAAAPAPAPAAKASPGPESATAPAPQSTAGAAGQGMLDSAGSAPTTPRPSAARPTSTPARPDRQDASAAPLEVPRDPEELAELARDLLRAPDPAPVAPLPGPCRGALGDGDPVLVQQVLLDGQSALLVVQPLDGERISVLVLAAPCGAAEAASPLAQATGRT